MSKIEQHNQAPEISIILPCLNEEEALPICLSEINTVIARENLNAEIILVDNGSTDGSRELALTASKNQSNLIVVDEPRRGYGSTYIAGLQAVRGKYIFMADADCSYDFNEIPAFVSKLKNGNDLVIGNRFNSKMEQNAMPWLHQYIGNPVLSFFVKKFFNVKINDIHCGARAITREAFKQLTLYTRGMEFASEMIIKAAKKNLILTELPIRYRQRKGISKLRSLGDGWRHLRFILLYSPTYLFLLPGLTLFGIGAILMLSLYFGQLNILGVQLSVHPMFLSSVLIMLGYQIILFAGFSRIYAITHLGETDHFLEKLFKQITIERAGFTGIIVAALGVFIYVYIIYKWIHSGFGSLDEIKNSILALTFIVLGIQTFFSAFMLSTLGIQEK